MPEKPLYYWLPSIFEEKLKGVSCSSCHVEIKLKDIVAIGMRSYDDKNIFYVEYQCPQCSFRSCKLIDINTKAQSIESLCYFLLESIQKKKKIQCVQKRKKNHNKKNSKTNISDKEISEIKAFMKTNNSHDDFLKFIGFTGSKK